MPIVVPRAVDSLPHRLNVERVLSDEEFFHELVEEFDLGLQTACVAGWSFTDPDDAFVRIEFEKEELATAAVRCDVVDEVMSCFSNLHGIFICGVVFAQVVS